MNAQNERGPSGRLAGRARLICSRERRTSSVGQTNDNWPYDPSPVVNGSQQSSNARLSLKYRYGNPLSTGVVLSSRLNRFSKLFDPIRLGKKSGILNKQRGHAVCLAVAGCIDHAQVRAKLDGFPGQF